MSSLCAPVGLLPMLWPVGNHKMLLGATFPLSSLRWLAPEAYTLPSVHVALIGSWLISRAYGAKSSLSGVKRLPTASTSEIKPALESLLQLLEKRQFGPQAR